jgi:hypothetical protein
MSEYQKGDRVIVTDLRTGSRNAGVVTKPPAPESATSSGYLNVRYDTGEEVRVGKGFVQHEADA